jgi:5-methyltetrahydropteroyltriglutamate--homocysteine methyltransferase
MAVSSRPPFRADHVGSFLRPQELLALRDKVKKGEATRTQLRDLEDKSIRDLVAMQERLGLHAITDGEFRRDGFHTDFLDKVGGMKFKMIPPEERARVGSIGGPFIAAVDDKLTRPAGGMEIDNFKFLNAATKETAKITIPSPTMLHFRGGRKAISEAAYPDIDKFFDDVAKLYRDEIKALADAGCKYVQYDDTNLAYLCDPQLRDQARARGDDPDKLPSIYAKLINESIKGRPADMAVAIHLCRGNAESKWFAQGGYEPIAEAMFNELEIDGFFLEYDDERSGDFAPLRFVPKGKTVVLGLITSKTGALEKKADVERRIDAAAKYVSMDQLCLSPQCGFASASQGNKLSVADQEAKMRLVVDIANEVWH